MEYKFLNQINFPDDLRKFKIHELKDIANELRSKTIDAVSLLYKEIKLYKEYKESRKKDDGYTVTIIHPEELDEGKNRLNE